MPRTVAWLVWASFLLSQCVLLGIGVYFTFSSAKRMASSAQDAISLRPLFLGVTIAAVLAAHWLFRRAASMPKGDAHALVAWALGESAAIFGLVLALMGAPLVETWLFFALGFLSHFLKRPSDLSSTA